MHILPKFPILLPCIFCWAACSTVGKFEKGRPGGIVGRYVQGSLGAHANIYWIETVEGPVVIDAPLSIREARRLRSTLIKPYRIYVTSARPERTGGLEALREGDIPAFTTPALAVDIKAHLMALLANLHRDHPGDVPAAVEPPLPSVDERTHTILGEVEIELLPLGPAESKSSLAVYLPKTGELICGDVVAAGEHLDMTQGQSTAWQARIAELKALEPKSIYPGHGAPGGPELLSQTIEYIKDFQALVAQFIRRGGPAHVSREVAFSIRQQMLSKYPKLERIDLLERSIPAEYAVQMTTLSTSADASAPADRVAQTSTSGADERKKKQEGPASGTEKMQQHSKRK
jgi:glyoxylase-like metal-dependent hydrolase (beta-lactamase superfamily II)